MSIPILFFLSALLVFQTHAIPNPGVRITLEEKEVAGLLDPLLNAYLSGYDPLVDSFLLDQYLDLVFFRN
jgi:hypothetical protein